MAEEVTGALIQDGSPRPWRRDDGPDGQWDFVVIGEHEGQPYGFEATHDTVRAQADAAFIVRAVNAYDGLREAVREALTFVPWNEIDSDDVRERLEEALRGSA
jgi:hypothetical protein